MDILIILIKIFIVTMSLAVIGFPILFLIIDVTGECRDVNEALKRNNKDVG